MPEDIELLDARFLLQASKNKSYQKQVRQMLKTLACFLQENHLVTRELLPETEDVTEDFVIRRSDLTDVGFELYRSAENRWFDAVDRGVSPSDTRILERSLRLIRERSPA
jgi:hypothetical protein